jgi:hypothetical protein
MLLPRMIAAMLEWTALRPIWRRVSAETVTGSQHRASMTGRSRSKDSGGGPAGRKWPYRRHYIIEKADEYQEEHNSWARKCLTWTREGGIILNKSNLFNIETINVLWKYLTSNMSNSIFRLFPIFYWYRLPLLENIRCFSIVKLMYLDIF